LRVCRVLKSTPLLRFGSRLSWVTTCPFLLLVSIFFFTFDLHLSLRRVFPPQNPLQAEPADQSRDCSYSSEGNRSGIASTEYHRHGVSNEETENDTDEYSHTSAMGGQRTPFLLFTCLQSTQLGAVYFRPGTFLYLAW
jgi:hypothetical protein